MAKDPPLPQAKLNIVRFQNWMLELNIIIQTRSKQFTVPIPLFPLLPPPSSHSPPPPPFPPLQLIQVAEVTIPVVQINKWETMEGPPHGLAMDFGLPVLLCRHLPGQQLNSQHWNCSRCALQIASATAGLPAGW